MLSLNECQTKALAEIIAAARPGDRHLLSGNAGSGKTTLMLEVAREFKRRGKNIVMAAPTHKAAGVLREKTKEIGVDCKTIHSLLTLRPQWKNGVEVYTRPSNAPHVDADIVVLDECSMAGSDMMMFIRNYLKHCFVLFVGDPAQLPPVGEDHSQSFDIKSRSHLNTIVRQAKDNPILKAATEIRERGGWSWVKPQNINSQGIFLANERTEEMLEVAFTSEAFEKNPDSFRYICYRNIIVDEINRKIQKWRFGEDLKNLPFMPGERAIMKAALVDGDRVLLQNNQEVNVLSIEKEDFIFKVPDGESHSSWEAGFSAWKIKAEGDNGSSHTFAMTSDENLRKQVVDCLKEEGKTGSPSRFPEITRLNNTLAKMSPCYAMTAHSSQGSTFQTVFVNIDDIKRAKKEAQQMSYVAVTRASASVIIV